MAIEKEEDYLRRNEDYLKKKEANRTLGKPSYYKSHWI